MNIMNSVNSATKILKAIGRAAQLHKPEIKVSFGIAGNIMAMYWMYKKAPDIKEGLEEKDYVKVAKAASGPVLTSIGSNLSIVSGVKDIRKDLDTAATAYAAYESMLSQRIAAEEKVLKKGKQQEIDHEIAKDIASTVSVDGSKYPIIETGMGNSLIYDPLSQRLFRADIAKIYDIFYEIGTAVSMGERVFMDDFWSSVSNIQPNGYEHSSGFDIECGVPNLTLEPVDRGPNTEILNVMLWKNVAYFTNSGIMERIDRRYLDYATSTCPW